MFYIDADCPDCDAGYIGFFKCSDNKSIILRCDECSAIWLEPSKVKSSNPIYFVRPGFKLPSRGTSLEGNNAGWATKADIENVGWSEYIDGEYNP